MSNIIWCVQCNEELTDCEAVCSPCQEELNKNTEGTISSLRADIKHLMNRREELEAELKTFTHGIPIEKAKDGKDYLLVIKSGDEIIRVAGHYCGETKVDCNPPFTLGPRWETDLNYRFYFYEEDREETELLGVYPLPSQNSQTQERS